MPKAVTFLQLQNALLELGFEAVEQGRHVIFKHRATGAVLSVPNNAEEVRPIYVVTAIRQVANSEIATASSFETMLYKAAKSPI